MSTTLGIWTLTLMALFVAPTRGAAATSEPSSPLPGGGGSIRDYAAPTWIDLEEWAEQHDLGELTRISASADPSFELATPRGRLVLQTRNLRSFLDGTLLWLGFPPTMRTGRLYIHHLDIAKSLAPLLIESPFRLPADAVIVIDPGHGGGNSGTRSVLDASQEKHYTLDWALQLEPMLTALGWTVWLTRTNDTELALDDRVAFANEKSADLFISLHFNSAGAGRRQSGAETFSLTPQGMPSHLKRGYPDELEVENSNNAYDSANIQLATALQNALLEIDSIEDRGIKRARFMTVLRDQKCPAALVEAGFLSNPDEAGRIANVAHRRQLAMAVVSAIVNFGLEGRSAEAASLDKQAEDFEP